MYPTNAKNITTLSLPRGNFLKIRIRIRRMIRIRLRIRIKIQIRITIGIRHLIMVGIRISLGSNLSRLKKQTDK